MPIINIKVAGKIAENLNPEEKIVCGNEDYDVHFDFDESWSNKEIKTGLFIVNGELIAQPFNGDICPMPRIENTTLLAIGVKSSDGELYTTTPAFADCLVSAENLAKNKIPAPSKDVYDQIIELLNQYIEGGALTREELKQVISDETADIREKANQNEEKANNAVSTAESAQSSASQALAVANSAEIKATGALETAQQGIVKNNIALETANNASAKADSAILTANDALSVANEAKNTADNIDEIATQALQLVNAANADISKNAEKIAENKTSIGVLSAKNETKFQAVDSQIAKNENAIENNEKAIAKNASDISVLQNSKQDNLSFDGDYNAQTNKAATVETVARKIAQVVAGADDSLDTLKEIADWIKAHPNDVAELNALITTNATNIATNTGKIALLNSDIIVLQGDKLDKEPDGLNTASPQVVGAINELKDDIDEAKGKLDTASNNATSALTISNEAKDKAQTAIDKVTELETATEEAIAQAIEGAKAYTDEKIQSAGGGSGATLYLHKFNAVLRIDGDPDIQPVTFEVVDANPNIIATIGQGDDIQIFNRLRDALKTVYYYTDEEKNDSYVNTVVHVDALDGFFRALEADESTLFPRGIVEIVSNDVVTVYAGGGSGGSIGATLYIHKFKGYLDDDFERVCDFEVLDFNPEPIVSDGETVHSTHRFINTVYALFYIADGETNKILMGSEEKQLIECAGCDEIASYYVTSFVPDSETIEVFAGFGGGNSGGGAKLYRHTVQVETYHESEESYIRWKFLSTRKEPYTNNDFMNILSKTTDGSAQMFNDMAMELCSIQKIDTTDYTEIFAVGYLNIYYDDITIGEINICPAVGGGLDYIATDVYVSFSSLEVYDEVEEMLL